MARTPVDGRNMGSLFIDACRCLERKEEGNVNWRFGFQEVAYACVHVHILSMRVDCMRVGGWQRSRVYAVEPLY